HVLLLHTSNHSSSITLSSSSFTRPPPTSTPLSLHDALPISQKLHVSIIPVTNTFRVLVLALPPLAASVAWKLARDLQRAAERVGDRKSTRLNSSHVEISYAVFCLKKKKKEYNKLKYVEPSKK